MTKEVKEYSVPMHLVPILTQEMAFSPVELKGRISTNISSIKSYFQEKTLNAPSYKDFKKIMKREFEGDWLGMGTGESEKMTEKAGIDDATEGHWDNQDTALTIMAKLEGEIAMINENDPNTKGRLLAISMAVNLIGAELAKRNTTKSQKLLNFVPYVGALVQTTGNVVDDVG